MSKSCSAPRMTFGGGRRGWCGKSRTVSGKENGCRGAGRRRVTRRCSRSGKRVSRQMRTGGAGAGLKEDQGQSSTAGGGGQGVGGAGAQAEGGGGRGGPQGALGHPRPEGEHPPHA